MGFPSEQRLNKDYIRRINVALEYIDSNLNNDLSLDTIASIASYSPFHFHRIFKAVIGETLNSYINRRRLEKIAAVLMHKEEVSITEVAFQSGFSSNSSLTKAFKKFYGVSPSEFRKQLPSKFSKIGKSKSKNGKDEPLFEQYICNITNHLKWIEMNAKIEIKELPDLHFASVTQIGVEGLENAFEKIFKWGRSKGIMDRKSTKTARIFHDSFKVTSPDKVRMSVSLLLEEAINQEGDIQPVSILGGRSIVASFEITPSDFEKSWSSLFIWMNEKGYQKSERTPFEIYHNDFREHPEGKFLVDFYIPIQ
ncbi:AraC family transcriptional regulator [Aquimarina litoralis]|uniref:AraC family transcriptional regulator n=1 Tax=Aquimarina litoralis TaxID=584605 RepID=UPI001C5A1761|nr:AraC family transcriptional regulator [Aquimarina litoralis]MBW1295146.1 helix-turn-helix domain-containing protein [Aquimarina litoralis]